MPAVIFIAIGTFVVWFDFGQSPALTFGLVYQLTDSYRPAIFALILFFVVGGLLLYKVDPRKGIEEAGNAQPRVV